jgi:hypothetical protein
VVALNLYMERIFGYDLIPLMQPNRLIAQHMLTRGSSQSCPQVHADLNTRGPGTHHRLPHSVTHNSDMGHVQLAVVVTLIVHLERLRSSLRRR